MAGICSWPWKREVAQNSFNQANKCGAPSPPPSLLLLCNSQTRCAVFCGYGMLQHGKSMWESHFYSHLPWFLDGSRVAGWWISWRWVFWIEAAEQRPNPFIAPLDYTWKWTQSKQWKCGQNHTRSYSVWARFGWTKTNWGCCASTGAVIARRCGKLSFPTVALKWPGGVSSLETPEGHKSQTANLQHLWSFRKI